MRVRAFGLDVTSSFPLAGMADSPHVGDGRALELELRDGAELDSAFAGRGERIAELRRPDGSVTAAVDRAPDGGYLIEAAGFGRALMSTDARHVAIAPEPAPDWAWQRYLTGQVAPLAALLQGLELFHAAVVERDGAAVAVVAGSGVGKTTVGLELVRRGLGFVADDVLVVEAGAGGTVVHPAVGLANVRAGAGALLAGLREQGLAEPIGSNEQETRIALSAHEGQLPLAAVFVLTPAGEASGLEIEPLAPVDPKLLLAATFNLAIQTPDRLTRQLDVCAQVARSAPVHLVRRDERTTPAEVAEAILSRTGR